LQKDDDDAGLEGESVIAADLKANAPSLCAMFVVVSTCVSTAAFRIDQNQSARARNAINSVSEAAHVNVGVEREMVAFDDGSILQRGLASARDPISAAVDEHGHAD
jgi:hypothetical protein